MKPENAKAELEKRIEQAGTPMADLTLAQGVRLMLDFYHEVRAENCKLDEDGDMLLFQWGGGQNAFECDITRQFIVALSEDEDDEPVMSQLSFTFHFAPSPQSGVIKSGNQWCYTPNGLADFESFINTSDIFRAVHGARATKVTLDYRGV